MRVLTRLLAAFAMVLFGLGLWLNYSPAPKAKNVAQRPTATPRPLADDRDGTVPPADVASSGMRPSDGGRPAERTASPDDAKPEFQSGLIKSLGNVIDQNRQIFGDDSTELPGELQDSLARADQVLSSAKASNRAALRQANRQQRLPGRSPHLLVVLVEGLDREDLGCYGQTRISTPSLDRVAARGVRLSQFTVSANSAAENLTALRGGETGPRLGQLPEMLWQSGYTTALLGDCSWGGVRRENQGGWEHWFGWEKDALGHRDSSSGGQTGWRPPSVVSNGRTLALTANGGAESPRFDDVLRDELASFAGERKNSPRPLAVVISVNLAWWKSSESEPVIDGDQGWPEVVKRHAAAVTAADRFVGGIAQVLEKSAGRAGTIVMVAGIPILRRDSELELLRDSFVPADEEADRRVESGWLAPLIASWPGVIPAGFTAPQPAGISDLAPTIAEMIDAARRPRVWTGRSQWKSWRQAGKT